MSDTSAIYTIEMWFSYEAKRESTNYLSGKKISGVQLTYEMLIREEKYADIRK